MSDVEIYNPVIIGETMYPQPFTANLTSMVVHTGNPVSISGLDSSSGTVQTQGAFSLSPLQSTTSTSTSTSTDGTTVTSTAVTTQSAASLSIGSTFSYHGSSTNSTTVTTTVGTNVPTSTTTVNSTVSPVLTVNGQVNANGLSVNGSAVITNATLPPYPTNGQFTLAGLGDVSETTLSNGQYLTYNSTSSKWSNTNLPAYPTNGSFALSGLSDVSETTLSNGQYLTYNSTSNKWKNTNLPLYPTNSQFNFSGLGDVLLSTATNNDILQYNGSKWVNQASLAITGNGSVGGNFSCQTLTVNGQQQTVTGSTVQVEQGVIELNQGNTNDTLVSGFATQYVPGGTGSTYYSGLVRMPNGAASSEHPSAYTLFQSATDPGASNSTTNWTYSYADLYAGNGKFTTLSTPNNALDYGNGNAGITGSLTIGAGSKLTCPTPTTTATVKSVTVTATASVTATSATITTITMPSDYVFGNETSMTYTRSGSYSSPSAVYFTDTFNGTSIGSSSTFSACTYTAAATSTVASTSYTVNKSTAGNANQNVFTYNPPSGYATGQCTGITFNWNSSQNTGGYCLYFQWYDPTDGVMWEGGASYNGIDNPSSEPAYYGNASGSCTIPSQYMKSGVTYTLICRYYGTFSFTVSGFTMSYNALSTSTYSYTNTVSAATIHACGTLAAGSTYTLASYSSVSGGNMINPYGTYTFNYNVYSTTATALVCSTALHLLNDLNVDTNLTVTNNLTSGYHYMNQNGSASSPCITWISSLDGTSNTGLWHPGDDSMGITAGANEICRFVGGAVGSPQLLLMTNGSRTKPSISWSADGSWDTGFYWIGDGQLGITCNSINRATFDSNGLTVYGGLTVYASLVASTSGNAYTVAGFGTTMGGGNVWSQIGFGTYANNGNVYNLGGVGLTSFLRWVDDGASSSYMSFMTVPPGSPNAYPVERFRIESGGGGIRSYSTGNSNYLKFFYGTDSGPRWYTGADQNNNYVCYNGNNVGCWISNGGNGWNGTSDRRLKTNIEDEGDVLSLLMKIQPRTFNWIDPVNTKIQHGFIAQEIQEVYPEMVNPYVTPDGTEYLGIELTQLIAPLVKSVQQLNTTIVNQQTQIDALMTRLNNAGIA